MPNLHCFTHMRFDFYVKKYYAWYKPLALTRITSRFILLRLALQGKKEKKNRLKALRAYNRNGYS